MLNGQACTQYLQPTHKPSLYNTNPSFVLYKALVGQTLTQGASTQCIHCHFTKRHLSLSAFPSSKNFTNVQVRAETFVGLVQVGLSFVASAGRTCQRLQATWHALQPIQFLMSTKTPTGILPHYALSTLHNATLVSGIFAWISTASIVNSFALGPVLKPLKPQCQGIATL